MKKILSINKTHRMAVIEPGVTYEELNEALAKEGMTISHCLSQRPANRFWEAFSNWNRGSTPCISGLIPNPSAVWR
jgi:FAD/FMN-containing dehydrogenase